MKILTVIFIIIIGIVISVNMTIPSAYAHHERVVIRINPNSANTDCTQYKSCYNPYALTVKANRTIEWQNRDVIAHTVTSGSALDFNDGSLFDSGLLKPKHSFFFTFKSAGKYNYFCAVHPWQTGVIDVQK